MRAIIALLLYSYIDGCRSSMAPLMAADVERIRAITPSSSAITSASFTIARTTVRWYRSICPTGSCKFGPSHCHRAITVRLNIVVEQRYAMVFSCAFSSAQATLRRTCQHRQHEKLSIQNVQSIDTYLILERFQTCSSTRRLHRTRIRRKSSE